MSSLLVYNYIMEKDLIKIHNEKMLKKMEMVRFIGDEFHTVPCYFCPDDNKVFLDARFAKSKFPTCSLCKKMINLSVRKNGLYAKS